MVMLRNRKLWIDSIRAIAIIMVVFGHQIPEETSYFVYTSTVKMPLFFAISGYLFSDRGGQTIVISWSGKSRMILQRPLMMEP